MLLPPHVRRRVAFASRPPTARASPTPPARSQVLQPHASDRAACGEDRQGAPRRRTDATPRRTRSSARPQPPRAARRAQDVLQETFRFIRTEEDDRRAAPPATRSNVAAPHRGAASHRQWRRRRRDGTWEQRLARRYYDKLFKARAAAPPPQRVPRPLSSRFFRLSRAPHRSTASQT